MSSMHAPTCTRSSCIYACSAGARVRERPYAWPSPRGSRRGLEDFRNIRPLNPSCHSNDSAYWPVTKRAKSARMRPGWKYSCTHINLSFLLFSRVLEASLITRPMMQRARMAARGVYHNVPLRFACQTDKQACRFFSTNESRRRVGGQGCASP